MTKKRPQKRKCCNCKKYLPQSKFHNWVTETGRASAYCKVCKKEWRLAQESTVEGYLKRLVLNRKNRTKKDFKLTPEQAVYLYKKQGGMCALTGRQMTYGAGKGHVPTHVSLDRINPNRGYTVRNVQLTCADINRLRGQRTMEELQALCEMVLNQVKVNV